MNVEIDPHMYAQIIYIYMSKNKLYAYSLFTYIHVQLNKGKTIFSINDAEEIGYP